MNSTTHVIANKFDFKIRSLVDKYDMNIVHYKWVCDCASRGFLLELEPTYMVYTNEQLQQYFLSSLDRFNDHYTQPVDKNRMQELI